MNKIFKVIFNKSIGKLVVASELSKSNGKSSSSTDERENIVSLFVTKLQHQAKVVLMLGLLGTSSVAYAAIPEGTGSGREGSLAIGSSSSTGEAGLAVGARSAASGLQSTAIGTVGNGIWFSICCSWWRH